MLKHTTGLRPHGLTVRLVLVVLGGVEVPVAHSIIEASRWLPHLWSLQLFTKVPRTDMFCTMWVFLNRETDEKQETAGCRGYSGCFLPDWTHPKCISSAEGVPDGPLHQLWRIMRLKTSVPRRMSTRPGTPKSWSAKQSPVRCFHRGLEGTGNAGKGAVILGSTTTSTPQSWWGDLIYLLRRNPGDSKGNCVWWGMV